ncbi:MAG: amidase [Chloroflexi bacterium]|nr:amidase [Chloroflexota bacterium]
MPRTLTDIADAFAIGNATPTSLTQQSLRAFDAHAALNVAAFRADESALELAERLTNELRHGCRRSLIHGVPITVKDLFVVDGMPTRGGTRALLPDLGGESSAVARLKAAGAVIVAKTNMHEIAAGVSGENQWTGDVCNPHDPARQAGGSSSGSAASVAAHIVAAALGSDTAGSIRVPAAFCGVVGFKPSFGLIPLDGALALCWSCDHGGPLANSVADAHVLTEVLAARAIPLRPTAQCAPVRLGVPRHFLEGWLSANVRRRFDVLLTALAKSGVVLIDIDVDGMGDALDSYAPLRAAESAQVHHAALARNAEDFSPAVRERLLAGRDMSLTAYLEALRARARLTHEMARTFGDIDAMILPTAPLPAPLRGSTQVDLERGATEHRAAFVRLTLPFSFTGVPALAVPFGAIDGMPISVQLAGPIGADARVLEIGRWLEQQIEAGA